MDPSFQTELRGHCRELRGHCHEIQSLLCELRAQALAARRAARATRTLAAELRAAGQLRRAEVPYAVSRDEGDLPESAGGGEWLPVAFREKELEQGLDRGQARCGAWTMDDRVVQVLFGVGMTLQAALVRAEQPALRDQLERAVGDIDELVEMLRHDMVQLRRGQAHSALA